MVRFSDMLGGDGEPDDGRAATAPRDLPPLIDDDSPDPDAPPVDEQPVAAAESEVGPEAAPSPQDVLDRLTQFATANRAAAPEPEPPAPPAPIAPAEPPAPVASTPPTALVAPAAPIEDTGDDILPRGKRSIRSPRGKRRDK